MSSGKIENQLLDAIETVVNNAVAKANYDRTVQASIVRCENEATGKYTVKYQDSLIYAYSSDTSVIYPNGTGVYVLIPSNDTGLNKQIIGTIERIGEDYLTEINEENRYEYVGKNCISVSDTFGLCSYTNGGQNVILYEKATNTNQIGLNVADAELYLKESDYLICGGYVQTNLNIEQQYAGNYGMCFELMFKDHTGARVKRTYLIDIDQMHGNPYQLSALSKQCSVFEIDGENFEYINKIYIFEKGFPNVGTNKPNDIFISNLQLYGASLIPVDENSNCSLVLITHQGVYFDNTYLDTDKLSISTQVRVKGNIINSKSDALKYYWFRENNLVTYSNSNYSKIGGAGWECLNNYTLTDEGKKEWIGGEDTYYIQKTDVPAKTTRFKCVVVYNGNVNVSREVTIYNYSSPYEISIVSTNGENFYYDLGKTDLICLVNGENKPNNYTYIWSVVNNNGMFTSLTASRDYSVSKNKISNVQAKTIVNYSTFQCSVFSGTDNIGSAYITITNGLEGDNSYSLVINNGNQVFKYNENGISPAADSEKEKIDILPLSFTLYDNGGSEISNASIGSENVKWFVPDKDTMIDIQSAYGEPFETIDGKQIYTGYEIGFDIDNKYNSKKTDNTIILEVAYDGSLFIAKTNLVFLKEGEVGTNGTEFVCRLLPNTSSSNAPAYPVVTYNSTTSEYSLNYNCNSTWLKAYLWHDGELIYSGTATDVSNETGEDNTVSVSWSVLKNSYDESNVDNSMLEIDSSTGAVTFTYNGSAEWNNNPADIIKCTLVYQGVTYYATMPIIVVKTNNSQYTASFKENSGFLYAMYTTDGRSPQYDNSDPFEINLYKNNVNVSQDSGWVYTWSTLGSYYSSEWKTSQDLIERSSLGLTANQRKYKPADTCSGLCVSNAIYCKAVNETDGIEVSIHIPIHLYLNRFGNAALNGWDGNSISIDENKGIILSPVVGAGKKDGDNGFTGLLMGTILEAGSEEETGLFGYNDGERTITLSAEDGSAKFGSEGSGQIVINPNEGTDGHAYLRSGKFDIVYAPVSKTDTYTVNDLYFRKDGNVYKQLKRGTDYTEDTKVNQDNIYKLAAGGKGLEIDLTDPHILFGNGNFRVDSNGQVYASEYATVNMKFNSSSVTGLDTKLEEVDGSLSDLQDSVNYLDVIAPTDSILIETDSDQRPVSTANKTIEYIAYYKGGAVRPTISIEGSYTGISNVGYSYDTDRNVTIISLHVESNTAITNSINTYTITFNYGQPGCKPVTKKLSVVTLAKGADGTSVTIKGSYENIDELCLARATGNELGDGYILDDNSVPYDGSGEEGHLFIFTNGGNGGGMAAQDWRDVGKFRGQDGTNGRSIQSIAYMYLTSSSSLKPEASDSGWKNVMDAPDETNRYVWQKETITFVESDGTLTTQVTVFILTIYGQSGNGIETITIKYKEWDNATTIPGDDDWEDNPPSITLGKYLWSKTTITYTDGRTPTSTYSIAYSGTNGEDSTSIYCGNESAAIMCGDTNGGEKTLADSIITIPFDGFIGKKKAACTVSVTGLPSDGSIVVNGNSPATLNGTNYTRGTLTLKVLGDKTLGNSKTGTITLTFTCNGLVFIKYFTWYKIIKGNQGPSGYNNAQVYLYQRKTTAPAVPAASTTYTFATHTLSGTLGSWSQQIPSGTEPLYVTVATANANAETDTIASNEWCTPFIQADLVSAISISSERQQFIYTDGTPDVSSITLTASSVGTWYYYNGTSYVGANLTASSITVGNTSSYFNGNVARFKVTATINGKACEDYYSIYKIYNGTNGISPDPVSTVFLTNENITFTANKEGKLASDISFSCNIVAYTGTTKVIPAIGTITGGVTNKLTVTQGSTTASNEIPLTIKGLSGTDLGGMTGQISIPVTSPVNTTLKINWSKVNTGQTGKDGINTATLYAYKRSATAPSAIDWSSDITYTFATSSWIIPSGSTWNKNIIAGTDPLYMSTATAASNTATDIVTAAEWSAPIKIVENGTTPFLGYLTNEAQTFAGKTEKTITTQLYGYLGTTEKKVTIKTVNGQSATTTLTDLASKTGMQFKVSSTSAVQHPTITFKSSTSLPTDQTEQIAIVYRIESDTVDRTLYFSYSSTAEGIKGDNAKNLDVTPSAQVFKSHDGGATYTPEQIVLTPRFENVTYSKWQYSIDGGATWTDGTSGTHGITISNGILTIESSSDLYNNLNTSASFRCISNDASVFDVVTISRLIDSEAVSVGGRNLVSNGETDGLDWIPFSCSTYYGKLISSEDFFGLEVGETYTVRCRVKTDTGKKLAIRIQFYNSEDDRTSLWSNVYIQNGEGYTYYTSTLTEAQRAYNRMDILITTSTSTGITGNTTEYYRQLKLERGNIATDWTPSVEDINESITKNSPDLLVIPMSPLYAYTNDFIYKNRPLTPDQIQYTCTGTAQQGQQYYIKVANAQSGSSTTYKCYNFTMPTWDTIKEGAKLIFSTETKELFLLGYEGSLISTEEVDGSTGTGTLLNFTSNVKWSTSIETQNGLYLWQTTPIKNNGILQYSTPVCLTQPKIVNIFEEYCVSNDGNTQPNEKSTSWVSKKPSWEYGKFLWIRSVTLYDGTDIKSYTNYHVDTEWSASSQLEYDLGKYGEQLNALTSEGGVCQVTSSGIYITSADKKSRIVMNQSGIGFQTREDAANAWGTPISVWATDGTFDAQNISVNNLTAESIVNGNLSIGKNYGQTQNDGKLFIYDTDDHLIVEGAGSTGLTVQDCNGKKKTLMTPNKGLIGYKENGTDISYEQTGDKFKINQEVIGEEIEMGTVVIKNVTGTYNGVAFVPKS